MNCKNYQTKLEEMIGEKTFPTAISSHLKNCVHCQAFKTEREKMMQMLQNLETVNTPGDFNFRVKARIRQQQTTLSHKRWQKLALLVPTALAVLIIGFVLVKTFVLSPAAPQNATVVLPSQSETSQPQTQIPPPENLALKPDIAARQENELADQPLKPREVAVKQNPKPRFASRSAAAAAAPRVLVAPSNIKDEPGEIHSRDSAGNSVKPSLMPPGIPNPLETVRKQNGKDLLETLGIKIISENEGLRVVSVKANSQGAKAGLAAGDLVEKINGENPTAISGSEFTEINLTVRRKDQSQEIKISAKP